MPAVLVDTGPLVALLDRSDAHHLACRDALRSSRDRLVTVWPVLTEATHLLAFSVEAQDALLEMVALDAPALLPLQKEDLPRIRGLMRQYRDLPMDFADAALVRVAERERIRRVLTLDRRDFGVYRAAGIGKLTLLP